MKETDKKGNFLTRAFRYVSGEVREMKRELTDEVKEIREESAEFLEHHGTSRIKTGLGAAFKTGVANSIMGGTKAAGVVAKYTWFIPKANIITVPAAFIIGATAGPFLSKKAASVLRGSSETEDNAGPESQGKAPPSPPQDISPK